MRASRGAKAAAARDQHESEFTAILRQVVSESPSARAAALFDEEGETVDYAGTLDAFDVRIAAAHCQILLSELQAQEKLPPPRQLRIRARKAAYVIVVLDDCYSLVVITHPRAPFAVSERVLRDAELRLAAEAGFAPRPTASPWHRVDVDVEGPGRTPWRVRPAIGGHRAESAWSLVDVIGCLVGTRRGERGYRIRLDTGLEANLVCERSRAWFLDEPLA